MNQTQRESFGDFQTPPRLARQVCQLLHQLGVEPGVVVEPSCGYGAFLRAAHDFFPAASIQGFEINPEYVEHVRLTLSRGIQELRIEQADFFSQNWPELLHEWNDRILILGNPPWVTNAQQGISGSPNLPEKRNESGLTGLAALTGKSNFDISEWMGQRYLEWLDGREGWIAILIKEKVARMLLARIWNLQLPFEDLRIYFIDAKKEFQVNVSACLFYAQSSRSTSNPSPTCQVFASLTDDLPCSEYTSESGRMISNAGYYRRFRHFITKKKPCVSWRSGVKHDCAEVFELQPFGRQWTNGLNEVFSLEEQVVYPLLKSSNLYNGRLDSDRHLLLPSPDLATAPIDHLADCPLALAYLARHADRTGRRKSRIYLNKAQFSVFGVGPYSLMPWKVAVSGLYKEPRFVLVGPRNGKPTLFDDTVYFLPFPDEASAQQAYRIISSEAFQLLLNSMMFTADKRPVTAEILNRIDLERIGEEIGVIVSLGAPSEPSLFG